MIHVFYALRAAALIYRNGLGLVGLLAPGVVPNLFGDTVPKDLPEEVDKQYLTLLINLAQALLNIPTKDMHGELAAMEASIVSGMLNNQAQNTLSLQSSSQFLLTTESS